MKTKSKLVLGLSILSAATLAAGATSTFAWFQTANAGVANSSEASLTSSLKTAAGEGSIGTFKVEPVLTTETGTVVLTDDLGDTYFWNGSANVKGNVGTQQNRVVGASIASLKITYEAGTGTTVSDSNLDAMFASAKPATYKITISDDSQNYTPVSGETKANANAALKFFAADHDFDTGATPYQGASTLELTVTLGNVGSFSHGEATVQLSAGNTFKVGVKGVDGVAQYATDVYVIKAVASQGA